MSSTMEYTAVRQDSYIIIYDEKILTDEIKSYIVSCLINRQGSNMGARGFSSTEIDNLVFYAKTLFDDRKQLNDELLFQKAVK
jgi:hypothetical protein